MKTVIRLAKIPDGAEVLPDQVVMVRRSSDGSPMGNLKSDAAGMVTMQQDGHPEPYYFHLPDVPGGDKFWTSTDAKTAGTVVLKELPQGLRAVGDRVIPGVGTEFFLTLVSGGPNLTIGPGAAVVAGHPFVTYGTTSLNCSRPVSGILTVRVVIRLCPDGAAVTPGKAELFCHEGEPGGGAPALTQTSDVWEMPLYTLTIPDSGIITFTSDVLPPAATVTGESRAAGTTTTNTSGAALPGVAPVSLVLPAAATYDVTARLSAVQYATAPEWVLQGTYGPVFNGLTASGMGQVADVTKLYVTDDGQNRVFTLDLATGAYIQTINITNPFGVALDIARSVYISYVDGANGWRLRKFDAAHALQWTGAIQQDPIAHLTVFGSLWATNYNTNRVSRYNTSTGAFIDSFGSAGTGNGQFNVPWGICYNPIDGYLYVVDSGNNRMQVFTTAGAYVRQFSIGAGSKGVANDAAGNLWIANQTYNVLEKQSPTGVVLQDITHTAPMSLTLTSTDIIWVVSADGTVSKWDETPGGYGEIAINLNGATSPYVGPGNRVGAIGNVASTSVTMGGPGAAIITPYGKATANQLSLQAVHLDVTATPRSRR